MNDDVKTLREAAFACTIRYANTHMSTNDRLYFDAIKICFNRMADMIEREDAPDVEYDEDGPGHIEGKPAGYAVHIDRVKEREAAAEDRGWNAAIEAAAQMALDCDTMGEDYADDELTDEGKAARRKCRQIFAEINSLRKGSSHG